MIHSLIKNRAASLQTWKLILSWTGWGTDEKALIEILGHRTAAQRAEIAVAYEGLCNESLLDRLHSELSGDFRVTLPPATTTTKFQVVDSMVWIADPA